MATEYKSAAREAGDDDYWVVEVRSSPQAAWDALPFHFPTPDDANAYIQAQEVLRDQPKEIAMMEPQQAPPIDEETQP